MISVHISFQYRLYRVLPKFSEKKHILSTVDIGLTIRCVYKRHKLRPIETRQVVCMIKPRDLEMTIGKLLIRLYRLPLCINDVG